MFEQTALQIVIELLLDEVRYGSAFGFQPGEKLDWRFMVENDAPIEQYAYLGLQQPK